MSLFRNRFPLIIDAIWKHSLCDTGDGIFGSRISECEVLGGLPLVLTLNVIVLLSGQFTMAFGDDSAKANSSQKGRKYVNKIPYDVYFDNPLQVVNDNKTVAAQAQPTPVEKTVPAAIKESPGSPASSSGRGDWNELIPIEEIQSEVKTLRNSLTKATSNQGQFNQNFKLVAIEGAELAALAGIVQEHPGSVTWKDKAQYVREFGSQLNQSAVGMGKENFDKSKSAAQKLISVLDGSIPADAGEVPSVRPFHEVATRKSLMKRIDRAKDWLKQDVNSEAKFKSMSDQILHETALITAFTTIVTRSGYDYTENDDYQGFAKELIQGAKDAAAASKDDAYDRFKQAIDRINKSCTDCHGTYGNS